MTQHFMAPLDQIHFWELLAYFRYEGKHPLLIVFLITKFNMSSNYEAT